MKKIIFMLIAFFCVMTVVYYFESKSTLKKNQALRNHIYFKGTVMKVKTSNNHSFGIILVSLDTTNIEEFEKSEKANIFPYEIRDNKAEIYTEIPDGISSGDVVTVNSTQLKVFFYYTKTKQRFEAALQMVTDFYNIEYIKENSSFH